MGTRRGEAFTPEILQKLDNLTNVMRTIGDKYGVECAQVAIAGLSPKELFQLLVSQK
ncbi:hypothetical protein [Bacillus massiliigorillae]|uniref:hypothetical protein n=1 Tax=Bacillus massiliigorillae TaxID=1243664 RepID=UPI00039FEFC0|nr:hypothetical protein [Bacillus massiliigorillae]